MHEKPHELRVKASGFIMQVEVLDTNMGKNRDLTDAVRLKITSMLGYGQWRRQNDNWGWANIHICAFCLINFF